MLKAPKRIEHICLDIKKHYSEHIEPKGFKAMIVTGSRRAAITYKKILDGMNGPQSAVIISGITMTQKSSLLIQIQSNTRSRSRTLRSPLA